MTRWSRFRRGPRSLRTTVTAAAALTALVVVALAGVVIALRLHGQDLHQVDQDLRTRADKVSTDAGKLADPRPGADGKDPIDHDGEGLDAGSQSLVRVFSGSTLISQHGDISDGPIPAPTSTGYSTVTIGGQDWRSLVEPVTGGQLQVLQSLAPVQQRLRDTEQIVIIVASAATLVTAITVWLATGAALGPLQRLRAGAARIRTDRAHDQRLPEIQRPFEVAELTTTLNGMLDELDASMQSTRRFTADAGHELRTPLTSLGIDLETLRRNPDLPTEQRAVMLAAMTVEHARIVNLLAGLQELARGDAHALPARASVHVAGLTEECVQRARQLHPRVTFDLQVDSGADDVTITGWSDGLRTAVINLLDNAAIHGRPAGHVYVTLAANADTLALTVDDDGAGLPVAQRGAMRDRFTRGDTTAAGSGLGLALVDQQAALHGGELELGDAPQGGLRATILLPLD